MEANTKRQREQIMMRLMAKTTLPSPSPSLILFDGEIGLQSVSLTVRSMARQVERNYIVTRLGISR